MSSDAIDTILLVAKTFGGIILAQFLDDAVGVFVDLLGELYDIDSLQDDVVGPHWIRGTERRAAEDGRERS